MAGVLTCELAGGGARSWVSTIQATVSCVRVRGVGREGRGGSHLCAHHVMLHFVEQEAQELVCVGLLAFGQNHMALMVVQLGPDPRQGFSGTHARRRGDKVPQCAYSAAVVAGAGRGRLRVCPCPQGTREVGHAQHRLQGCIHITRVQQVGQSSTQGVLD